MNFKHKYMFLLPGLLVLLGILIFPIGFTVRLSLSSWDSFYPALDVIGLENYVRLFTDDARVWEAFGRLSLLSLTTVFLQYVIGFALALMVWKDIVFQRFFRVLFLIPMMTTPVIMTVIWRTFFHESLGPVNDILSHFEMTPLKIYRYSGRGLAVDAVYVLAVACGLAFLAERAVFGRVD